MPRAEVGEDHVIGANDVLKEGHFTWFGRCRLEDGDVTAGRAIQKRKRNPHLALEAPWRAENAPVSAQDLHKSILGDRLAAAAHDSDNRCRQLSPPPLSELLQCLQWVRHSDDGAARVIPLALALCEYHSDGAVSQRIARELMTVSSRARQGEEKASLHDVLGVDGHMTDEIGLWCPAGHRAANDVG